MISKYDKLLTPCYIFDVEEFDRGVAALRNALARYFDRAEIGYSFKTNTLPYAIERGRELGCRAEVVSHDEYELARLCGFGVDEIIYNGPMKSRTTFFEALTGRAIVNIETKREIEWLESYRGDGEVSVGIRLNIDLNEVNPKEVGCCDGLSRFGFSEKAGEFADAVARITAISGVRLAGLHIHRTTDTRSVGHYRRAVEFACRVIRKYNLSLEYLDIGGGFFGIMRNKPTFAEYAKGIYEVLDAYQLLGLRIIVEPGFAILSNPFKFVTRVIDTKCVGNDTYFVTTDGSRNDIDPMFRKTGHKKDIYRHGVAGADRLRVQMVSGCSCMENDRLFTLKNEAPLECGDIIVYHGVGAYTMTLSPMFIRLIPRVYARDPRSGQLREVRRAGCASDLLFPEERNAKGGALPGATAKEVALPRATVGCAPSMCGGPLGSAPSISAPLGPFLDLHGEFGGWSRHLPHMRQDAVMQFVTFRLGDSLPQCKLDELRRDKALFEEKHPTPWSAEIKNLFSRTRNHKIEYWLEQGYGECVLRYQMIRKELADAIHFMDGSRCLVLGYVIMPNHVHLLLIPLSGYDIVDIVGSVRQYSARRINKLLARRGRLWDDEPFDRMVRGVDHMEYCLNYIRNNPKHIPVGEYELYFNCQLIDGILGRYG